MSLSVTDNHIILVLECYWQCQPFQPLVGNGDMLTRSYPVTIIMISVVFASTSNLVSPEIKIQFTLSKCRKKGGGCLTEVSYRLLVAFFSAGYSCSCVMTKCSVP